MQEPLTMGARMALVISLLLLSPAWAAAVSPPVLEPVRGEACWTLGDGETPLQAEQMARMLAEEQAVRSHRVYEQSSSIVNNLQLEDDLIQSACTDELQQVHIVTMQLFPHPFNWAPFILTGSNN